MALSAMACLVFTCQSQGAGRDESIFHDHLQLRVGAFWPELHSSISLSTADRTGDRLDFEDDLDLDENKTTFYGGIAWRFSSRHSLDLEYFDLGRDGSRTADKSWDIGDYTVLAEGRINSTFDVAITRLSYQYKAIDRGSQNLGVIAGIHNARLEAGLSLSGALLVDDKPVFVPEGIELTELSRTDAPLPHLGVAYGWAYSPEWTLHASIMGFSLSFDEYEGALLEANISGQYQLNRYIGIGGGLKYFQLDVTHERKQKTTDYDFDYFGPALFITATF